MRRKLIKQGAGGYTVSLPIKWVRAHNLEPGQEIDVIEEENSLKIVSIQAMPRLKKTTLAIEKAPFTFYRSLIGGLYRGGYDEITITFKDQSSIPELQKTINLLPGYELLSVAKNSCVIKSTLQHQSVDLHSHFLKIVHSITAMQQLLEQDIAQHYFNSEQHLLLLRNNVLKNRDFVIRSIAQHHLTDEAHLPYYTLVSYLWTIARSYSYISQQLVTEKSNSSLLDLFHEISVYFNEVFSAPRHVDPYKVRDRYDILRKKVDESLCSPKCRVSAAYLLPILLAIESCNSSLVLLSLNSNKS